MSGTTTSVDRLMIHPWREVRDMPQVTVTFLDLPDGLLGFCDHDSATIYLANGMRQRQRRSVLAHEMKHLERGPVADCDHLSGREERAVEGVVSHRLIPLQDLIEALLWSRDEQELAEELWTDVATVRDRLRDLSEQERRFVEAELDRREMTFP